MNNLEFISVDNVIENWKMIAPNEINYNEDLLREWIIDSYYDIGTYRQYKQRVQILNVKDFKVKLPCGFKQTLYVLIKPDYVTDEQFFLTELTKQDFENEACTWTYKKTCKCSDACSCDPNYIETNGWMFIENLERAKTFHHATVQDFTNWFLQDRRNEWIILQPKRDEVSLLRHENLDFGRDLRPQQFFDINNGYLITDFKEGKILLGYLSVPTDENDLPMIPNNGNFVNALIAAIERKYAYIQYRKTRSNADANFLSVADSEYKKYKMKAISDMNTQTFDEMWSMGMGLNQFIMPNSYKGLDRRTPQKINNGFTRY
jgi:hypothetical protein